MTQSISRVGVTLLLLVGCLVLSSCERFRAPTAPPSLSEIIAGVPAAPKPPALSSRNFSMTIVSMDNPFDCVLQNLNATRAQPQTLRVSISGTNASFASHHFGLSDVSWSLTTSETHYEFTTSATGFRWYGDAASPVRNGVCPYQLDRYVITYARFPIDLIESTAASTHGKIDLVITAVKYSETALAWVPFGETRVVGEVIRVQ